MDNAAAPGLPVNSTLNSAPRVVAVSGGRREVGTSCIVVNIGAALAGMGKKVMIFDAALGHGSLAHLLGLQPSSTILDVLAGRRSLAEAVMTGPAGIQVMPGATRPAESDELTQAQKLLLLEELEAFVQDLDFILVDAGAGTSGNVLYFNLGANERIVVADQEPASVIDAYTLIKVLGARYDQKRFKLLFNKISSPPEARRSFEQLSKVTDRFLRGSVSLEYLGVIPEDASLPKSVDLQQPLLHLEAHSPAGLALAEAARCLMVQEPHVVMDGNIKFFWQSLNRRAADSFCQGDCHASQLC